VSVTAERVPFTMVPHSLIQDTRLSRRAKGVMIYILSFPPEETPTLKQIIDDGPEGRDAIRTAIAELRACGYLKPAE
jgi:hypothetical protein